MKIVAICGSPRKGNTEFLAKKFLETAEKLGASTEIILLREKNIQQCTGCDACYGTGKLCTIKDDFAQIAEKLLQADLIVLATPNYFENVSGMIKVFIDRTNELCNPPQLQGKKAFLICAGGQKGSVPACMRILKRFAELHKMQAVGKFIAVADKRGEIEQKPEIVKKLERKARKIVKAK